MYRVGMFFWEEGQLHRGLKVLGLCAKMSDMGYRKVESSTTSHFEAQADFQIAYEGDFLSLRIVTF